MTLSFEFDIFHNNRFLKSLYKLKYRIKTSSLSVEKYLLILFVILVIEFAARTGSLLANHFQNLLSFIDPNHAYSWGILHHIVQFLIPLLIMIFWPRRSLKDWGFRIGDVHKGLKWIYGFTLIWIGIYSAITVVYLLQNSMPKVYYDVTNMRSFFGELGFRAFIVGLSEETLFRAFPITILIVFWNRRINIFRFTISQAGIIAAVIFCYAHIGYYVYPFQITHFNVVQLFTAAGLGLFYAIVFEETKSILYPIIIHSISDVIPVLGVFVLHFFQN